MKKVVVMMLLGLAPVLAQGQTNSVIEKMRRERAEMQEQLARQEKILTTTESDIKSQVSNLNIITVSWTVSRHVLKRR